jgi:hypothetical protein
VRRRRVVAYVTRDRDGRRELLVGDGDDAGLTFRYRWLPITPGLRLFDRAHPRLAELAKTAGEAAPVNRI